MIFEEVRAQIAEVLAVNADEIKMNTRPIEDLNADSLDVVELSVAFERRYGLKLPEDELIDLDTVRDIVNYIERRLAAERAAVLKEMP
ncbi:MAG: acyl carrier protein [Clostridiaceae bacterium]|nr:acyl carrier protein [Clostridiaceae bacterium]